ncbi:MAG: peptidoglycan DD-metalloendopeptidase family protein [Thiobacillaceae bacterium]|nr:peptidoglycan DD-metalloendopeptidase family protein [Hydrogenophilales bacterium]MBP8901909.1 peptidoglycan DD-metalloendopeptidase family protein [Thiobacillaceae bacterium]MBP9914776.1 peptidoglycan DD-metalloendopeptidase family protein [Thiobacillaceae bacterium]
MRALPLLLVFLFAAGALAAPDTGKQQELKDLRGRIQSLQEELEQAHEDRSEVADALKKSERRISDVNRGLRDLESRQRMLSRDLRQLNQDTRLTQSEIAEQQKRLVVLLRERYIQGGGDAMKLLLNGQNPGEVARNLEYYGYIGRARAELIRQHRQALARLRTLQDKTRQQNDGLTQVRKERVAQKQTLEAEKGTRQQVLYKLSEQIRQQRQEIDTLVRDEKRLTRLIEKLAKLAATAPKSSSPAKRGQSVDRVADASLAGLDFHRLKGKLALPLTGEILHKFGQNRDGGGPAWKGLFIRARQGQEVRAVGSGRIAFADWLRGFGNLLIVDHGDGYLSLYSNNESLYKQPGEPVRAGDVVAAVGATGGQDEPGLYFELRHQGKPFDPLTWVR